MKNAANKGIDMSNTESQQPVATLNTRQKVLNTLAMVIVSVFVLPFFFMLCLDFISAISNIDSASLMFKKVYWYLYQSFNSTPILLLSLPIIFVLQHYCPAVKAQSNFNHALALDALYSVAMLLFYIAVASKFFDYLKTAFFVPRCR